MHIRIRKHPILCAYAAGGLFTLLCRRFPHFSGIWNRLFIRTAGSLLSSASSRFGFPLLEIAGLILIAWIALGLLHTIFLCLHARRFRPAKNFVRQLSGIIAVLFCTCAFLWFPSYWGAPSNESPASAGQLNALCGMLIDRLNAAELRFSDHDESLALAQTVVSAALDTPLPANAVKTARYPEWMNAFGVSGFYSPWTGEAVVHPDLAPAARIFTAVHELIHAQGVADEGHANILAWTLCRRAGDEAATSADLFALRYAMHRLRAHSEDLWRSRTVQMQHALREAFASIGGFGPPPGEHRPPFRYSALADRLAASLPD